MNVLAVNTMEYLIKPASTYDELYDSYDVKTKQYIIIFNESPISLPHFVYI